MASAVQGDTIRSQVREYLRESFLSHRPAVVLGDADSLLRRGIIDSIGMAELLVFLETTFQIEARDAEFTDEYLGTIDNIVGYVLWKLPEEETPSSTASIPDVGA